jgi:nucleoside-diphosphate-sugar epimerase
MNRVLVTGATGFIGSTLCAILSDSGCMVRAALRKDRTLPTAEKIVVGDISSETAWGDALENIDCVVHIAARAHVLQAAGRTPESYIETNARGTRCLAKAAAEHRIRKFIYLSSVKVNGEWTEGRAYAASDEPHPQDAYAVSKWLGERYLMEFAAKVPMHAIVIRSPLVYGPGVQANFLRLLRWVDSGWPIPLGSVRNARSLVSVWNLCDLLATLARNAAATGGTWMVSDGEDLSTPELLRRIARALGRRPRLLPVPVAVLRRCASLLGRQAELSRLCGSLTVDLTPTRNELGWSPPVSVDEGLSRTVDWYKANAHEV